MTWNKKASFLYGELDPALQDNTDLKAWSQALSKATNVQIGKTGSILNVPGTWFFTSVYGNKKCRIYIQKFSNKNYYNTLDDVLWVFTDSRVDAYGLEKIKNGQFTLYQHASDTTNFVEDDLDNLSFTTVREQDGTYKTYVACPTKEMIRLSYIDGGFLVSYLSPAFDIPKIQYAIASSSTIGKSVDLTAAQLNARLGGHVVYGITCVTTDGQESTILPIEYYKTNDGTAYNYLKLPVNNEYLQVEFSSLNIKEAVFSYQTEYTTKIKYLKVYRKPYRSGVWGYIGDFSNLKNDGTINTDFTGITFTFNFIDFGQTADYTNSPPEYSVNYPAIYDYNTIENNYFLTPSVIASYNSRFLMAYKDGLFFSEVNIPQNFTRDFPLTETNAFVLKIGTSGAEIRHIIDSNGIIIFTTDGIWYGGYDSPVSATNPLIRKTGPWVIDDKLKPLETDNGVIFFDKTTNSVKLLVYNDSFKTMVAEDVSYFSSHFLYGRSIVSWAYKKGDLPIVVAILDNGKAINFTFNRQEKAGGWCLLETDGLYEQVDVYNDHATNEFHLIYIVNRNGTRCIELESQRVRRSNNQQIAFSHSSILEYDDTDPYGALYVDLVPQSNNDWTGTLRYEHYVGTYFTDNIGKYFKVIDFENNQSCMLRLDSAIVGVEALFTIAMGTFPEALKNKSTYLHLCHTEVTGLDHLNNKLVSVVSDGSVLGSPYNDKDNYPVYQVIDGKITLPEPSAFTIVGLPYISDIATLEIDNQNGTVVLDAKIVNQIVIKYIRSRGGFIGGEEPKGTSVANMDVADSWNINDSINTHMSEKTKRVFYNVFSSNYKANGRIYIRHVDPTPLEISSIILDVQQ